MNKADALIEETERLEREAEAVDRDSDPEPLQVGISIESLKGKTEGNKSQCKLCGKYYVDLSGHLTGKNNCSRALSRLGIPVDGESVSAAAEPVQAEFLPPGFVGSLLCNTFLNFAEQWLSPDFVEPSKRWREQFEGSIQFIVDTHFGGSLDNPYFVLVACLAEFAMANREGIRRKFESGKDRNDKDQSVEEGIPSSGVFGDTGIGENDYRSPGD